MRAPTTGWRDPRLWVGVAIVAVSVLVGVRVLAGADDTVPVWAVASDVGPGDRLDEEDLVARSVRFADGDLGRYFEVDDALPDDVVLLRGLGAGELLPRSAIGDARDGDTVEVSLAVAPLRVPTSVAAGSVVDVYVAGRFDEQTRGPEGDRVEPAPALGSVTVVDAPLPDDGFAVSGDRQIVLAVAADTVPGFYALLDSVDDPMVSIVRHS